MYLSPRPGRPAVCAVQGVLTTLWQDPHRIFLLTKSGEKGAFPERKRWKLAMLYFNNPAASTPILILLCLTQKAQSFPSSLFPPFSMLLGPWVPLEEEKESRRTSLKHSETFNYNFFPVSSFFCSLLGLSDTLTELIVFPKQTDFL